DCVRFWGKCSQTSDCCPHLACKSKWPRNICVWDGSV
nr:omega-Grammotoxin SIA, omega-GsTx SIA=voltage-sensitive calcium channel responses peptidergic blocker [Grammostola spatulata=tarantula spiders, venom, Peptide, 36 aa] [Grammostola rosea]1KOZ_A Chain A, Voltage-dependent Channel Inhibitor [synthetic construct]